MKAAPAANNAVITSGCTFAAMNHKRGPSGIHMNNDEPPHATAKPVPAHTDLVSAARDERKTGYLVTDHQVDSILRTSLYPRTELVIFRNRYKSKTQVLSPFQY
jgi:hypothetical protein